MAQHKRYSPNSIFMDSSAYLIIPVKACFSLFTKLSGRCRRKIRTPLHDLNEDTMVGYESSWAGIYKDDNVR